MCAGSSSLGLQRTFKVIKEVGHLSSRSCFIWGQASRFSSRCAATARV